MQSLVFSICFALGSVSRSVLQPLRYSRDTFSAVLPSRHSPRFSLATARDSIAPGRAPLSEISVTLTRSGHEVVEPQTGSQFSQVHLAKINESPFDVANG